jgi:hypothetical protein
VHHELRALADGGGHPAPPGWAAHLRRIGGRARRRLRCLCGRRHGEIGIDISRHAPRTLRDLNDTSFDFIVTLSPEAHHQALELTRTMAVEVEYWPTFDATMMIGHGSREQILQAYRDVRDSLFRRIKQRFGLEGGPTV